MDRMICKKDLVLFLFPHRTYVWIFVAILTNIQVITTIFVVLTVLTSVGVTRADYLFVVYIL